MIKRISYFIVLTFVLLLGINKASATTEYCRYAGVWLGGQYAQQKFEVTLAIDTNKIDKGDKYEVYKTKGSGQTAQSLAVVNYYKQDADLGVTGYYEDNIVDLGNYYKKNRCPAHVAIYDYTGKYGGYVTIPYSKTYNSKDFNHTVLATLDNQEIDATKSMKAKTICKATGDFEYNLGFDENGKLTAVTDKKGDKLDYFTGEFFVNDTAYCPKAGEVTITRETREYQIPGSTKYTPIEAPVFKATAAYRERVLNEQYIICPAVNDMEYSYIFNKGTGVANSRVKNLKALYNGGDPGSMPLWDEGTAIVKSRSACPQWEKELEMSKHKCKSSQPNLTWYEKLGGYAANLLGYKGEKNTCADAYNLNFAVAYKERVKDGYPELDNYTEGCSSYVTISTCTNSSSYSCLWVDKTTGKISTKNTNGYCNVDNLQYVQCGGAFDIPAKLPGIISFVINILKIAAPIILIFTSAITLLKAITASKEDEMTKARATMFKRIGIAAMIFFTITITQFVIDKVADDNEAKDVSSCMNCFINNRCETNKYYKNNINGEYKCYSVSDGKEIKNCH